MKNFELFTLVAFIIAVIVVGPVFTIMALNTIFNTGIELTFYTWLAVFWLQFVIVGGSAASKK